MNYVITIARGFGSGGKEIASRLAERLEIPCYERQILTFASQGSGIPEEEFSRVDEKKKKSILSSFLKSQPFNYAADPVEVDFKGDDKLFHFQAEVIRTLADTESCVIVGKCADYILRDRNNVVSIYIEAPRRACVRSIMDKLHISEKRAHELISQTDKYRANYYEYYTGGNYWTNPVNYDMTLNSDRVGRDKCVDIIYDYLKIKFGRDFNNEK